MQDEFLTVAEIAEMLKLNQQTVRNMIDRGELQAVRVGARRVRVRRGDLDAFLEASTQADRRKAPSARAVRGDMQRTVDMRTALADIRELTADGEGAFNANRMAQQAVAYNLVVLSEAARTLSPELRARFPKLPWRDVIALQNTVLRESPSLDTTTLWTIATQDVAWLDQALGAIETAERELAAGKDR